MLRQPCLKVTSKKVLQKINYLPGSGISRDRDLAALTSPSTLTLRYLSVEQNVIPTVILDELSFFQEVIVKYSPCYVIVYIFVFSQSVFRIPLFPSYNPQRLRAY